MSATTLLSILILGRTRFGVSVVIDPEESLVPLFFYSLLCKTMDKHDETLRIKLPLFRGTAMHQAFSVIEKCDASPIKSLIIQQAQYDRYVQYSVPRLVSIPETIRRLVAVETIKINACITELPVALSKLSNLKLLDLSGCYNLLSIPNELLEMKDLKIKIGDVISRASEVVFITVPRTGITSEVFSAIYSTKEKKIEQLIIRQMPPDFDDEDDQEEFEVPDEIKDLPELKMLSITGSVPLLPSWIGDMNTLSSLTVTSSRLESLPESIGNLSNLISLDLCESWNLVSLSESIGNLSNLTSLDFSRCSNLTSLPQSMANLTELQGSLHRYHCGFVNWRSSLHYLSLDVGILYRYLRVLGISLILLHSI